jgi:hypothetical protein
LITVADALGYDKIARLRRDVGNHESRVLLSVLESSMNNTNSLFFFPGKFYEISPFGTKLTHFMAKDSIYISNYIIAYPSLDEKFLRTLFTGIELLAFKLCHLLLENQKRGYHFETERFRARVRRMRGFLGITNWEHYLEICDEILFTRDAFAHSFLDIRDITYRDVPLRHCFDRLSNFNGKAFMEDVRLFVDPIHRVFSQHQLMQVDTDKLFRSCDQLIKRRTLAR